MQTYTVAAFLGLAATTIANPILSIPILSGDGSSVSCSSGNVYCTDGSKTECQKTDPGQQCTSGSVICCDSSATILNLQALPICGNSIDISIPVTVSVLSPP